MDAAMCKIFSSKIGIVGVKSQVVACLLSVYRNKLKIAEFNIRPIALNVYVHKRYYFQNEAV